jgi:flotillin
MPLIYSVLIPAAILLALLLLIGLVFAAFYKRSTRETSLVRTGSGGRKVIVDGGCVVIPVLHDLMRINMKTLRLEVRRDGTNSLITQDRMRVDVAVEFYVGVQSNEEGIARAAQTLGNKTFAIEDLREMIEGKLVDGLRSVAARMKMDELHEQRSDFVQQVQAAVSEDLVKNGLQLESVALTALDQTPFEQLDDQNAFNAVGMQRLAEITASARKQRAAIEANARVEIEKSEQQAVILTYEVARQAEEARINQSIAISELKANEVAELARRDEDAKRLTEQARISRERDVRGAEVEAKRALDIANQDSAILIAKKSEEESKALAEANTARALAVASEEQVTTARALAVAERQKKITILEAEQTAETEATATRVTARAEKDAADDRAEAILASANAEAQSIQILASASKDRSLAEAEGRRALIAAENEISEALIAYKIATQRLDALPAIIREMVAPANNIDSIKVHQLSGMSLGNSAAGHEGSDGGNPRGAIDQVYDAITQMAVQMPALKALGDSVGISFADGVNGVLGKDFVPAPVAVAGTIAAPEKTAS